VLAPQAAVAGNLDRGAQRRRDQVPCLAMIRRVPVFGLMLELEHGSLPASLCAGVEQLGASVARQHTTSQLSIEGWPRSRPKDQCRPLRIAAPRGVPQSAETRILRVPSRDADTFA